MTKLIGAVTDETLPPGLKVIVISAVKVTGMPEPDNGTGQTVRGAEQTLVKVPPTGHWFLIWYVLVAAVNTTWYGHP